MRVNRNLLILRVAVFTAFLLVSTLLPFKSFEGYSIISNTTSHLGAQGSPCAWVMNLTFVMLGITAIQKTSSSRITYLLVIGTIFGLSLSATGIFQHAPLVIDVEPHHLHDTLHSVFASTTGFSFTCLAAGHAWLYKGSQRYAAALMVIISIVITIMIFSFPAFMGISQRFMFITAFYWLFFYSKYS